MAVTASPQASRAPTATLLVDAHVHLHERVDCARLLDLAAGNLQAGQDELAAADPVFGALMLTEIAGVDRFAALAEGRIDTEPWRVTRRAEAVSLIAAREGAMPLFLIAGRQVAAAERLEVLALGTREHFPDGRPLRETLAAVIASGAIAVVPWGFGKWAGRRGRFVAGLFADPLDVRFYAGDNGGRPAAFGRPKLLAYAEAQGKLVLPGSDPLPLPGEPRKAGRYGFAAALELDQERPFASLKRWLEQQDHSPRVFGRLETLAVFVDRQVRLQLRGLGRKVWKPRPHRAAA